MATTKKAASKKASSTVKKKAAAKSSSAKSKKVVAKATKKTAPAKKATPKAKAKTTTSKAKKPAAANPALVHGIDPYVEKKGEEYMNQAQQDHFRSLLAAWKRELMEEVDRTVHHMQDEAGNFPDPNDRATQESEFSLELRTRDRERKLIKKIEETLTNLDNGDYGYCESCGVEIGIRRLEARPTATLCIDCKTLDEIRERQQG